MKILVLSNGNFIQKDIETGLNALQKEVGGYIEIPFISERFYNKQIDMIINEEGKMIDGLKIEIVIIAPDGNIADAIMGNVVFASHDEEGNTIGLTDEQIKFIKKELMQSAFTEEGYIVRLLLI